MGNQTKIVNRIYIGIRLFLGIVFIGYGMVKFLGIQLAKIHVHGDIDSIDPVTLVWFFFGYSQFYAKFIAFGELIGGILIIIPRTTKLGTLIIFGLALNITVMDYCFSFPNVKYNVTIYTILAMILIAKDFRSYRDFFISNK